METDRGATELRDDVIDESVAAEYDNLIRSLWALPGEQGQSGLLLPLTEDAWGLLRSWVNLPEFGLARKQRESADDLAAALSKMRGQVSRFAIVLAICRGERASVRSQDMSAAMQIADWFVNQAEHVYRAMQSRADPASDDAEKILRWAAKEGRPFKCADALRGVRISPHRSVEHMRPLLDGMVERGLLGRKGSGGSAVYKLTG